VTDADLVLGRLNGERFLGGGMRLDRAGAQATIRTTLGDGLGLDAVTAACGIATIVDGAMSLAVRAVSVNRGIDPRDTAVIAFGGAGPLHAAAIAREISIPKVIIPKLPGNFSALGMLMAEWRQDFVRTLIGELGGVMPADTARAFADLRGAGEAALARDGLSGGTFAFAADLRYRGQEHTIAIPVIGPGDLSGDTAATRRSFDVQHDRRHGHAAPDQSIEIVNLRLVVTLARMDDAIGRWLGAPWSPERAAPAERRIVHDDRARPVEADILWRPGLAAGTKIAGPAVIEEPNSTTFVPPGDRAVIDAFGNIVITLGERA
jgi:N-methylhydantoinase A